MSDDRTDEIKKNILSPSQWVRILYMLFYAVACWALLFVLPVIILCQVVISLISGSDNRNLRDFGGVLSDFFHEAMNYLLYVSDEKPWPFSDGEDFEDTFAATDAADNDADYATEAPATKPAETDPVSTEAATSGDDERDDVFSDISFTGDQTAADNTDDSHDGNNDADTDRKDPA